MAVQDSKVKDHIHSLLIKQQGKLTVTQISALLAELEFTIDQLMLFMLPLISEMAIMPISHFMVGAIVLGETGNLYVGASQEFSHTGLNEAMHAEQSAVAVAHGHGETNIVKIAVNASPCGHCRQFLNELADAEKLEVLLKDQPIHKLGNLLPHAFGPKELGVVGGLMSTQNHDLKLETTDELTLAALKAAQRSYSPYNKAYSGVALLTKDGRTFAGSYLENVAFNPSLPPLQAALALVVQSGVDYSEVVRGVLVQMKDNIVDQAVSAREIFQEICKMGKLEILDCRLG